MNELKIKVSYFDCAKIEKFRDIAPGTFFMFKDDHDDDNIIGDPVYIKISDKKLFSFISMKDIDIDGMGHFLVYPYNAELRLKQ
jgi:hypothetical protein